MIKVHLNPLLGLTTHHLPNIGICIEISDDIKLPESLLNRNKICNLLPVSEEELEEVKLLNPNEKVL